MLGEVGSLEISVKSEGKKTYLFFYVNCVVCKSNGSLFEKAMKQPHNYLYKVMCYKLRVESEVRFFSVVFIQN